MSLLDRLAVESPCSADWAKMDGTDTQRFCVSCDKAVYDLSAMAPCEAEALLARPGPAPCVRFLQRRDGTVVFNLARAAVLAGTSALAACGGSNDADASAASSAVVSSELNAPPPGIHPEVDQLWAEDPRQPPHDEDQVYIMSRYRRPPERTNPPRTPSPEELEGYMALPDDFE